MKTEPIQSHIDRTGKSQAQVAREIDHSPQALNNVLQRHDMFVVCDKADVIWDVGYYQSYYRRAA